jgi:DNA adenine methylase
MMVKPILRWAGSKRKLLPLLLDCVPEFERYVEPFAGSACLFFALAPTEAVLGDFNGELINAYRVLKRDGLTLARRVRSMPTSKSHYYELRDKAFDRSFDRAVRFLYLNHFCFNGVYRTNQKGRFNVPRGSKFGRVPSIRDFERCSEALGKAILRRADFETCVADVKATDFVYLDPPYAARRRRERGEYGYGGFGLQDVSRLVEALCRIDSRGAKFLLSFIENSDLELAARPHWRKRVILVRRHVAGFHEDRHRVREVLLANYEIPCREG